MRLKLQFQIGCASLLAGSLLSACQPQAQPVQTDVLQAGTQAIGPTLPAANSTTSPTVLPQETQEATAAAPGQETVSYSGLGRNFSFTYHPSLAQSVEVMTVEAVQPGPDVMFSDAHPAHVQFSFLGYNGDRPFLLPYPFDTPRLMAYPTQDFGDYGPDTNSGFPQQLADLRSLLESRPDLAERCVQTAPGKMLALPFLPWLNSAQVFCAQPKYIEFTGGTGIRYLTYFSQGPNPVLDTGPFYTFQGLTDNGEIYLSAVFPVISGLFPLEIRPGPEGQLPQNMTAEQLAALNAQPGDLFQPALG